MKKIIYIFLLGTLVLFSSCENFFEQTVTIDVPEHEPKLGITAIFDQDQDSLAVMVSKSVGALSEKNAGILHDATVKLFEGGNLISDFKEKEDSGIYFTDGIHFTEGQAYTLEVSAPNLKTVTSTQKMPSHPIIIEADFFAEKGKLNIRFKDVVGEDTYLLGIKKHNDLSGGTEYIYLDPNGITKESALDGYRNLTFLDNTFEGKETSQSFFASNSIVKENDTLDCFLTNVTKAYYYFDQAYLKQENDVGFFSEPIILPSNFENGFGLFALRNQAYIQIIAKK